MKRKLLGLFCAAMILTIPGTAYAENKFEDAITFDDGSISTVDDTSDIKGGTSMEDAVLLPLETRLYGTYEGEGKWFAFNTTSNQNSTYSISVINKLQETNDLFMQVYDESGNMMGEWTAYDTGCPYTKNFELEPNTTYYFWIVGYDYNDSVIDYMVIIREEGTESDTYTTTDSFNEAENSSQSTSLYPAENTDDADFLPLNMKFSSKVYDGLFFWFAFTTNSTENATYSFTATNTSDYACNLYVGIYDRYGNQVGDVTAIRNNDSNGIATTTELELNPDTTYYLGMVCEYGGEDTIDYSFVINAPEDTSESAIVVIEEETEELIFSTPFEINETQVQFVINSDEFMDKEAAKTAVEPVAEALLSHPDNAILIAGTTATDGTQESCVDLSNRRAAAVKNLLVSEFGIPESQIQTIGLGYEADPFERGQDREIEGDITSKFIESEGKKNRRVVIMDLASDTAQQILADNS